MKIGRLTFIFCLALAAALSGCHSSKRVTKSETYKTTGSSGRIESSSSEYYEKMKSDASSRRYESSEIHRLVKEATGWIGTPYIFSGHSTSGTDCSGLTMELFRSVFEFKLPRSSGEQDQSCRNISRDDLLPGDLVFFATGSNPNRVSHVGIYIGDGDIIHASSSRGVIVSNLSERYYDKRFLRGGRPSPIENIYSKKKKGKQPKSKSAAATEPSSKIIESTIIIENPATESPFEENHGSQTILVENPIEIENPTTSEQAPSIAIASSQIVSTPVNAGVSPLSSSVNPSPETASSIEASVSNSFAKALSPHTSPAKVEPNIRESESSTGNQSQIETISSSFFD